MKLTHQITLFVVSAFTVGLMATYGIAQPKTPPPQKRPAAAGDAGAGWCGPGGACMHGDMDCPMHGLSELADLKVEKTKTGAVLQLTAKDATKVAEVQAFAEKVGAHFKDGCCCPMMKGKAGEPHGHHHHGGPPMK